MTRKHLKAGSEMPPLGKDKLRLYSMIFCPFAQRARLVLAAKKIPFETVNVNLQSKPEWYLKLNPGGQVPCLHFYDGRVLPESLITSEYLDQAYSGEKLIPEDPFTNAKHKLFIEHFARFISLFFKTLSSKDTESLNEFKAALKDLDSKLPANGFFGGDNPAFVDYMIWPMIERLEAIQVIRDFKLDSNEYLNLMGFIKRMKEVPAVKEIMISTDLHVQFFKSFLSGGEINYDVGLKE